MAEIISAKHTLDDYDHINESSTQLTDSKNQDQIYYRYLSMPRHNDKYDDYGRNTSAQQRRQDLQPWITITKNLFKKKPI